MEIYVWEIYLEEMFSKLNEDEYSVNNIEKVGNVETQQLLKI